MRRVHLLLLSLAATGVSSWILYAQDVYGASLDTIRNQMNGNPNNRAPQAQLGELWSMPLPGVTPPTWSMGGGITWAWDPALCDALMERFSESLATVPIVTCADAKAAVDRAFNKWAGNNRMLKFDDVSAECDALPPSERGGPLVSAPNDPEKFPYHGGCKLAEVYVSLLSAEEVDESQRQVAVAEFKAMDVKNHPQAAMVFTNGERPFKWTAGQRNYDEARFFATYSGTLKFDVSERNCWYLDSAFCSYFHRFKKDVGGAEPGRVLITLICWGISLGSLIVLILVRCGLINFMCRSTRKQRSTDRDGDGKLSLEERWLYLLESISMWNPLALACIWCAILAPPLVLYNIFLPCWNCSDFEAAALHEIGHLIGLGHPDATPEGLHPQLQMINAEPVAEQAYHPWLAAGGKVNASNCYSLWDEVVYGVPSGLAESEYMTGHNGEPTVRSVMHAFTQNNPKACLSNDDVQALTMMYPDCNIQGHAINVCHKVNHNIGLVRVTAYIILPLMISLVVILCLSGCASRYLNAELEEARSNAEKLQTDIDEVQEVVKKNTGRGPSIFVLSSSRSKLNKKMSLYQAAELGVSASSNQHDETFELLRKTAVTSRASAAILNKRTTVKEVVYEFPSDLDADLGIVLDRGKNRIARVEPNSEAERLGVLRGGSIKAVNGEAVTEGHAKDAVAQASPPVKLTVMYQGREAVQRHMLEKSLSSMGSAIGRVGDVASGARNVACNVAGSAMGTVAAVAGAAAGQRSSSRRDSRPPV